MKQIILPIIGVVFFIVLVGLLTQKVQDGKFTFPVKNSAEVSQRSEIKINDITIPVEIANTDILRRKGLSNQDSLPEGQGMFFVFTQKDVKPPFWMKDMKFAIDIIWINDDEIVQIDKNVQPPAPGTTDDKLLLYMPAQPIDYVLEVAAGFSDNNNILVGNVIDISSIQ
ncbi:DUF192 domain-containing protein [Patescibacteria group bacterium]|nr:DUF192 domain-containing protein [Patescibacteria group bacterium]MBU0777061.1 DUF192 domain-containing protein [Patescibacteria group bacterium]MBU0845755.1 DUF192 domain-containing protein [Patescibacteria group bacterium]MBU0923195.1 DUF192 domain-containing protein [Patescibacteria group bacterium]MBU1066485.1 DUF192 domain-containing protein [Patescibacteria group bacterium]